MIMPLSLKLVLSLVYAGLFKSCVGDVCQDRLPDCADYTLSSCKSPYISWAFRNCPAFCGFCRKECVNNRNDCHEYGKSMCQPRYEKWAKQNCAEYCGYCGSESKCLYSPWIKLTPCSSTCDGGQMVKVRSIIRVPNNTPLSRDCNEKLIQHEFCNIKPCTTTTQTPTVETVPITEKTPVHEPVHKPDPVKVVTAIGTAAGLGAVGLMLSELFPPLGIPLLGLSLAGKRSSVDNAKEIQDLIRSIEEANNSY